MSDLNLDEIRRRRERFTQLLERKGDHPAAVTMRAAQSAEDVPVLMAEVQRLRAKLDGPCGSCHPCTEYSDETWRAAGRKPPHVSEWDELTATVEHLRADADASRLYLAEQRVSLAQGLAEDWAASTDVVLASAGRALLNTLGGAR